MPECAADLFWRGRSRFADSQRQRIAVQTLRHHQRHIRAQRRIVEGHVDKAKLHLARLEKQVGSEPWLADKVARLAKNLKAEIDEELIETYRGTKSLPFSPGPNKRVAVKIVDDRGIESLRIINLKS